MAMMNARDRQLNPLHLQRLRRALAADDQVQSRMRLHARRVALFIFAAFFVGIAWVAWHDTNAASLSTSTQFASRTSRVVSSAESAAHAAVEESTKMQRMATIQAAAFGAAVLVTSAHAQNSGYARFDETSDTIRILGNTVFPGTDCTYEMRIRLDESMLTSQALCHIVAEQRDSLEAKLVFIQSGVLTKYTTRGVNCGDVANQPMSQDFVSTWRHFAWVRNGSVWTLFIDGLLIQTWTDVPSCTGNWADSWMAIGMFRYGAGYIPSGPIPSFLGDLDWIHISAGARYTSEFTPPYECEVAADANTQLLLKFNEPASTTTLIDESASHFVCDLGVPVAPGVTATSPTLGNTTDGFPACAPTFPGDIDENSIVDGVDLAIVLGRWGTNPKDYPRADTNDDGTVDGADLAQVLGIWGACP